MRTQTRSVIWRFTVTLLLITLVLGPASIPASAAPEPQSGPQSETAAGDHLVVDISLSPDTPNILRTNNQDVTVNFHYITNQAGGVRIFARPFTAGALTPNYAACPSPLYPTGTGSGSCTFTITTGDVVVDQIRFQIWNDPQTTLLFEEFIPVYYLFSGSAYIVTNIALTPDTPDVLKFNQHVDLTFNYLSRVDARIFARPFRGPALALNYSAHGSPVYPAGSGSGTGYFTITSGAVVVDQIRIQMLNADQSELLFEAFLPVYYRFKAANNIVNTIEFKLDTPNIFKYNENINLSFNYTTNEVGGVRIFARPFSGASLSPGYAASGSPIYPTGSGSGSGSFTLTGGPTVVDKVRVQMWNANQTKLLFEAFLPVYLLWAGSGPPPGPDMHIDSVEVTQAIQDLNNSVDLVAGKKTFVRVHVSSPVNAANVYATLKGQHGFVNLAPILSPGNPGGIITVLTAPNRAQLNQSFWFELPSDWTTAGNLTLTARLDPNNAKFDPNVANNTYGLTVNFKNTPPLLLRLVNVQYTAGGHTYLAANSHLDKLESWLRRAYPIASLQVTRTTLIYPSSGLPNVDTLHGWLALSKLLRMIFSGEDSRVVYYGMVDDGGGFMRGKAAGIPSTIAAGPTGTDTWGWDFDGSYGDWYGGHEIGHTRGRFHAEFCGAGGGAPYPYPNGRISPDLTGNGAIYGFDALNHAIYDPNWKDVMTYCSNEWMSDFTYEGIRNYLVGIGPLAMEPAKVTATQFLAVMGMADLSNNSASLQSVYLINQDNTLPLPVPGGWDIALVGPTSNDLAVYPFTPNELTDPDPGPAIPAVISEVVPWVDGAVKVEIRLKGQVIDSRTVSANAPTVVLNTPQTGNQLPDGPFQASWTGSDQDGDPLTYSLLYSNDNGTTWATLAAGLSASGVELNTNQLPGGPGQLRVVVSDGLLSGQDTSGVFTVPLHAPSVQIESPTSGENFSPNQQVVLQGSAYDLEDGALDDVDFAWSSNLDGDLGTGTNLSTTELSTGVHIISLQVTDSDGMSTQTQVTINVGQNNNYLPVIGRSN